MKRIPLIMVNGKGQSIADGRGFVGVDETKRLRRNLQRYLYP